MKRYRRYIPEFPPPRDPLLLKIDQLADIIAKSAQEHLDAVAKKAKQRAERNARRRAEYRRRKKAQRG